MSSARCTPAVVKIARRAQLDTSSGFPCAGPNYQTNALSGHCRLSGLSGGKGLARLSLCPEGRLSAHDYVQTVKVTGPEASHADWAKFESSLNTPQ